MKDETFELLTKMYAEFSSFRKETTEKLTTIDNTVVRIENEHGRKIDLALDGYKQVYEKLLEHDQCFDTIEARLDTHDTHIGALKKKNA